ncbi:MAG: dipeptide/oligopeptide/nickel ABC transporter ATP-binding protein [Endomicrobia bacterium]|nr:dipeptide/oligopeptide/nickel ABC transporter ATP-binding protein [Endomicrobiia bacterium]
MFLEVANLTKTYITKEFFSEKKFLALDDVSFSLNEGEFLSVIGSSGSGKTTLGRILANILDFDKGSVKYFGKEMREYGTSELSGIVQMIFQNPYASLNPKLKIRSSFMEGLAGAKNSDTEGIIEKTLKSVGLEKSILDNYPHQFSGGQRQRIAVARILLKKPKLIIADEPFASLDIYSQNQMLDIFSGIKKYGGVSVMLITHDIAAAARFAPRMIIMDSGRIIKDDTTDNVFNEKKNEYIMELVSSMEI